MKIAVQGDVEVKPVILDTGIGQNIDEAFALALACNSPEIRLLGVTTVGSETPVRSLLARQLLGAYNRSDVVVATGLTPESQKNKPLGNVLQRQLAHQHDGTLAGAAGSDATDFIARLLTINGPAWLVATGPLTNIASVVRHYPYLVHLIEGVIFMGGWSTQALPESNVVTDPKAVDILLRTRLPMTAVGYEATMDCMLRRPHLKILEAASGPGPQFLQSLYRAWQAEARGRRPLMHDPLTVAILARPGVANLTTQKVSVGTVGGPQFGAMYRDARNGFPVDICTQADQPAYLSFLLERVAPGAAMQHVACSHRTWHPTLVSAYRQTYEKGWSLSDATAQHYMVAVFLAGTCTLIIGSASHTLEAGSVLFLRPGQRYGLATASDIDVCWLHFDVLLDPTTSASSTIGVLPTLMHPTERFSLLSASVQRAIELWLSPDPEHELMCQAALLEVLSALLSHCHEDHGGTLSPLTATAVKAKRYIESRASQPITLDDIAQHVAVSKFHLARTFRSAFNISPIEYHRQLRIERAKYLLRPEDLSIKQVADQLGYSSVSVFSRAFTHETGMSPSVYRELAP